MRFDLKTRVIASIAGGLVWAQLVHAEPTVKVDRKGNVYAAGPGGLLVISPQGKQLGTIRFSEQPVNLAWGDADRRTLYVTARTGLYRVRLSIAGAGVAPGVSP